MKKQKRRGPFAHGLILSRLMLVLALVPMHSAFPADSEPSVGSAMPAHLVEWIQNSQGQHVAVRLESVSRLFLGAPYLGDPLGEGREGKYDQDPLARFDGFDCTTFVETMMALAGAKDSAHFEHRQNAIRYQNGVVDFTARNHFPSLDWIPSVTQGQFAEESVRAVGSYLTTGRVETARAIIDKPNWYRFKKEENLQLKETLSSEKRAERVREWQNEGLAFSAQEASLEYLPFPVFFNDGRPNRELVARIPQGSIVNIVRPNWDLTPIIGTHMNVSHQMLFFRDASGSPFLRHASSTQKKVIDQDFFEVMRSYLGHSTARGIHLMRVLPDAS